MIDRGPDAEPVFTGPHVVNLRDWVELVRRLALPYYEEARLYWKQAQAAGWFDDGNEFYAYSQDVLQRIIEEFGKSEDQGHDRL